MDVMRVLIYFAILFSCMVLAKKSWKSVPRFQDHLASEVTITVEKGETVKLSCKIKGKPKPTTTWRKGPSSVFPRRMQQPRLTLSKHGDLLMIKDVSIKDVGNYTCTGRNRMGSIQRVFYLNVIDTIDVKETEVRDNDNLASTMDTVSMLKEEIEKIKARYENPVNIHIHNTGDNAIDFARNEKNITKDNDGRDIHINLNIEGSDRGNDMFAKSEIHALCEVMSNTNTPENNVTGRIHFKQQNSGPALITLFLKGFTVGENVMSRVHGIHIHEFGDLSNSCDSLGSHFNPYGMPHGGPDDNIRHVGDLGNFEADENGEINKQIADGKIQLNGQYSVIGRSIVIHQDKDDLGKAGDRGSISSGNAGRRIACCVIGLADTK